MIFWMFPYIDEIKIRVLLLISVFLESGSAERVKRENKIVQNCMKTKMVKRI